MNVVIVHGAYGYPEENWFPWLREQLEKNNISCIIPQLPTPVGQTLNAWLNTFNKLTDGVISSETILIGHSLGAVFLLRWLETQKFKVKIVYLIGAFWGAINDQNFDQLNTSFFDFPLDWNKILINSQLFKIFHGTDDPYVPLENIEMISRSLCTPIRFIESGGHLNKAAGFVEFPDLFDDLIKTNKMEKYV